MNVLISLVPALLLFLGSLRKKDKKMLRHNDFLTLNTHGSPCITCFFKALSLRRIACNVKRCTGWCDWGTVAEIVQHVNKLQTFLLLSRTVESVVSWDPLDDTEKRRTLTARMKRSAGFRECQWFDDKFEDPCLVSTYTLRVSVILLWIINEKCRKWKTIEKKTARTKKEEKNWLRVDC